MSYRAQFHDDILIDLIGYRRHGHNEGDEPAYTQPRLYGEIRNHPTVKSIWADRLRASGGLEDAELAAMEDEVTGALRAAQDRAREGLSESLDSEGSLTTEENGGEETAVPFDLLESVNRACYTWPEGFKVHPKLARQLDRRRESFDAETRLDWAYAETLAFGSILEGRHPHPHDRTGQPTRNVQPTSPGPARCGDRQGARAPRVGGVGSGSRSTIRPSPRPRVLGFEYGYSVAVDDLVLWEAQFGDFVNVAQVVIDQFVSSGRSKWSQESRLVMLLPHGYEGQGPEHSSARMERFLQLAAEDNMVVAYPTTPAQYFHLLRRQARRQVERPLVVMTPKSLLRLPAATSSVGELSDGGFRSVIPDPTVDAEAVERVVLCTGKFYYDLAESDLRSERPGIAVCRVEELYPFPSRAIEELVAGYPNASEVVWAQEEPRNMGALSFVGPRLRVAVPRTLPLRARLETGAVQSRRRPGGRPHPGTGAPGGGGAHRGLSRGAASALSDLRETQSGSRARRCPRKPPRTGSCRSPSLRACTPSRPPTYRECCHWGAVVSRQ